jgi:hypothetical protein
VIIKILELATFSGNFLGDGWKFVLDCVSGIEEMLNLGYMDFFDAQIGAKKQYNQLTAQQKALREQTTAANSDLIS